MEPPLCIILVSLSIKLQWNPLLDIILLQFSLCYAPPVPLLLLQGLVGGGGDRECDLGLLLLLLLLWVLGVVLLTQLYQSVSGYVSVTNLRAV